MKKVLEVKNLKISFRTNGGTLKAVRDISFDLEKGKTLAIVGESGSGKSVTSKAILGILAGNAIVEGGEILYDGKDLLRIGEDEMYKIRGDKISMIFQDPLSSLNPIVKIGKQITEAMLLKNKASRKEAKREFDEMLALLKTNMAAACGEKERGRVNELTSLFSQMSNAGSALENRYNAAETAAAELAADIEEFLFLIEKKQKVDVKRTLKEFVKRLRAVNEPLLTDGYDSRIKAFADELAKAQEAGLADEKGALFGQTERMLREGKQLLEEMVLAERPNFYEIGFFQIKNPGSPFPSREQSGEIARQFAGEFMDEFTRLAEQSLRTSAAAALEKKKQVRNALEAAKLTYAAPLKRADALKLCRELSAQVEDSIDRMEIDKDSRAYTFRSSLQTLLEKYFYYEGKNPKEEARFARQTQKREKLIAQGKTVDWKVVPKVVVDLKELQNEIIALLSRLSEHYAARIEAAEEIDFQKRSQDLIAYLQKKNSQAIYKVTKRMAKEKAVRLMEEVGIHEPRTRYYQYPFEFSGGMRQRIVIAIALAADPDILICDEPTTALDVTIQAQILELINQLKAERNLSVIFITHDLGVVANMADDIAVMYAGKIVEQGTAKEIFYDPRHPYTWALLSSMPDLDTKEKLDAIPGTPPNMIYPPEGDAFAERNKYAMEIDFECQPPMFEVSPTHRAATWLLHPDAPKVPVPAMITDRIERMRKKVGEQYAE